MITKHLQARHLHAGMEIVDGGDGVKRTAHAIGEVHINPEGVRVLVRKGEGFEPRSFEPREQVRVREAS